MMKKMKVLAVLTALILSSVGCAANNGSGNSGGAGSSGGSDGYVYYINFKPEADAAWQDLAQKYSAKTGTQVKIITAASGSYMDTLTAEMNKTMCPTLFVVNDAQTLANWQDYCYDLGSTKLVDRLESKDFCMYGASGALNAIGYCYECYGLIVNKSLLKKSGHDISEIKNFDTLKSVAEDIHSHSSELGFDAFTSSGLDDSSSWRFSGHLSTLPLYYEFKESGITSQPAEITGKYLNLYKNVWDLYIQNSATSPNALNTATGNMAEEEFGNGKAVFYQNGSWEYSSLTNADTFAMKPDDLAMIPIYCGASGEENAGLCSGTENYWAVNSKADKKSIDATIDFVDWVVSSDEGRQMMSDNFGTTPFKDNIPTSNVFLSDADKLLKDGKFTVTWDFVYTPNSDAWRAGVVSALQGYSAGSEDWSAVENAFVNGWSYQYKMEHGTT